MIFYTPSRTNNSRAYRTARRKAERAYRKALTREAKALANGATPMPAEGMPVHKCVLRAGLKLTPERFRARYMGLCEGCAAASGEHIETAH